MPGELSGEDWYGGEVSWIGISQLEGWFRLRVWSRQSGFRAQWAEVQRIKNELVGPEHEGVEVFGDRANPVRNDGRVEVWVRGTSGERFPFGYEKRWVVSGGLKPVFPSRESEPLRTQE